MYRYIVGEKPTVYFTENLSSDGLVDIFHEFLLDLEDLKVAVKISTGEPGGHYFLQPDFIKDLVDEVNGTIVECNTAYDGERSETESHLKVIGEHGFNDIADVDLLDSENEIEIDIIGGKHLNHAFIGANLADYDYLISLAHFKGHMMAGFGGAIKNCAIGISSPRGKTLIHSGGQSETEWGELKQTDFLESMVEAFSGIEDYFGAKNILYINVMNNLSIDCDCDSNPAEPEIEDIGILASLDPVALDQACIDKVYEATGNESLIDRIEEKEGLHLLEYAEEIGLGSKEYNIINIQ